MRSTSFVVLVVAALTLFFNVSDSYGQARPTSKNQAFGIDFAGYFQAGKEIHAQYEWKASPVNSWFARALFGSVSGYKGLGVGGGYKFFIADSRALAGLAVAPAVLAYFWSHEYLDSEIFFSLGGEVSYKHIMDDFFVEPLVGFGIGFGGDYISYLTKVRVYLNILIGYAW